MQARGQMQNGDCRLQTRGKMREKTTRNMSALVEVHSNLLKSIRYGQNVCIFLCCNRKVCLLNKLRCKFGFSTKDRLGINCS